MLYSKNLNRVSWQCIHYGSIQEVEQVVGELHKLGIMVLSESVENVKSDSEILNLLAKTMKFPDYFGQNWDALDECLSDMEWLPAKGYALFLYDSEKLWQHATHTAGKLVSAWLFAAENWSHEGIPFHLVFVLST
jgi:RNAse (barnase) inhibitor barstar